MGTLIAYLLMGLAALAFIAGVNNAVKHHYVDSVVAEHEKKEKELTDEKDKALARADTAEAANGTLQGSIKAVEDACKLRAQEFKDKSEAAEKLAKEEVAKARDRGRALEAALKALRLQASGPPTVGDACKQADAILSDLSRDVRTALGLVTIVGPKRVEEVQ